ncbi:MAG TPA: hypothetical protein VGR35_10095 [Tepidisphaeraceae bacterium]|nr:hypothetical protein [Tepidisphaeraceae bacterium]
MRTLRSLFLLPLLLATGSPAWGQSTQPAAARTAAALAPESLDLLKDRPDTPGGDDKMLGEPFESVAAGIRFRPPANMKRALRATNADYIVRYTDEARGWVFVATRSTFDRPIMLSSQVAQGAGAPPGLLELTRDQLKENAPGAEVVREDVINVGDYTVGMLAARYTVGLQRVLSQQAIVRADDRLYYTLSLTTPAARQDDDGRTPENDSEETKAVETFRAVVDTVALLDQSAVLDDQRQRLFRTRALFVNVTPPKLRNVITQADSAEPDERTRQDGKHEQFLRILQDGKDVGYTYVVENEEKRGAMDGVSVGVRSRTTLAIEPGAKTADAAAKPEAATTIIKRDTESLMWMSLDRKHETWRTLSVAEDGKNKDHTTEIGASDRQVERVLDPELPVGEKLDERNPPVRHEEVYTLTVTTASTQVNAEPFTQALPPFYLPQTMAHLLPRLLPLNDPKGYMFASYVGETRAVMSRYVDVGREQSVTLNGNKHIAVPVKDRIGLEGSVTTHWMSPEGKYLGSTNEESKITVLPTDEATLRKIWTDAQLTAPEPPKDGIPRSDSKGNVQPLPAGSR